MSRIKVAQIGVGHAHAAGKMQAFRRSGDFEVVGIAEPDGDLRRKAQGSEVYKDLPWMTPEQLLNVEGLQAVAVETRVADLLPTAEACIAAGKHIHLDKPAGTSLPRFKRILDEASRQHLLVQMGYMYRYNPGVRMLRGILKQGWLGEPFSVHAVIGKLMNASSRKALAEAQPGGMMFELGCHMLDLVIDVLGRPGEVTAINQHSAPIEDDLLDNMLAILQYPRAQATVHSSANDVDGFARRQLVVCGTEGTFEIRPFDNPAARLALTQERGKYRKGYQDVPLPKYVRYADDVADMARVIRHEKDPDYSCEHDLILQETLLKVSGLDL